MTEIMEQGSADPWKSLQQLALPVLCRVCLVFLGGVFVNVWPSTCFIKVILTPMRTNAM